MSILSFMNTRYTAEQVQNVWCNNLMLMIKLKNIDINIDNYHGRQHTIMINNK